MKDKTKRKILVIVGLAISAALAVMLAIRLTPPPAEDVQIPTESDVPQEVNLQVPPPENTEKEIVVPEPIEVEPTDAHEPTNGDDKGEEQTIQPDPEPKPEYTDEQLSDPTQTPDGEPVTPPTEENPTPPQIQDPPTQPTEPVNPSGGLPGFDDVHQGGEGGQIIVDGDGDLDKQVGTMD